MTKFTLLDDVADRDIVSNAVVFGQYGALHFTNTATVPGTVLTFTNNGIAWVQPPVTSWGVNLKDEGSTIFAAAQQMNFVGNGVMVTNQSGVPTITIPGVGNPTGSGTTEYVVFHYTAGSFGNLSATDAVKEKSTGVTTVTILDQAQCIVEFTFAFQTMPPVSIAVMGQVYSTNEFLYSNISASSSPSRRIQSGGTADSPTVLSAFGTATVRLQLRPQDIGATAGAGQRSHGIILFRF